MKTFFASVTKELNISSNIDTKTQILKFLITFL